MSDSGRPPRLISYERHDSLGGLNSGYPDQRHVSASHLLDRRERELRQANSNGGGGRAGSHDMGREFIIPVQRSYSFQRRTEEAPNMAQGFRRTSNSVAPLSSAFDDRYRHQQPSDIYDNVATTTRPSLPKGMRQMDDRERYNRNDVGVVDDRRQRGSADRGRSRLDDDEYPPRDMEYGYARRVINDNNSREHLDREKNIYQPTPASVSHHHQTQSYPDSSHLYEELAYDGSSQQRYPGGIQETDIVGDDGSDEQSDMYQPGQYQAEDAVSSSEEDDPEYLDLMEREKIIDKYKQGAEGKDIDPWENPDFDLYEKIDRFGFVHKEKSELSEKELSAKKRIEVELRREKKWLSMLQAWKEGKPKKLEERTWKGIPEKLRVVVWPKLLQVDRFKKDFPTAYADLLLRAKLISKDIKQIDLDINRTYRDHLAFRRRYDHKQQSLLNVLAAYSMYNTEVGYCQGMSQIAALFLMYLDEETAFWCLHSVMVNKRHTMHGFFVPGFPKLTRFEAHFKKVLKKLKRNVYKHLEKQDIPYIYLTKWWFGCFLDRVPFPLALRLWDVFLIEGDAILIAMGINIMKMHEKSIRKLQMENFMEFVQTKIANDFGFSDDETMFSLREVLTKLKNDGLATPPPARPEDLPEIPTKALGPCLAIPMADIRATLQEIQSRCSRANSTGRSPYPRRKKSSMNSSIGGPPPRTPTAPNTAPVTRWNMANNGPMEDSQLSMSSVRSGPIDQRHEVPFEIPTRRVPNNISLHSTVSTPPPDPRPYTNGGAQMNGGRPPMSARNLAEDYCGGNRPVYSSAAAPSRHVGTPTRPSASPSGQFGASPSQHSSLIQDEKTGKMVRVLRAQDDEDDPIRITHATNHVTYIQLGGDSVI